MAKRAALGYLERLEEHGDRLRDFTAQMHAGKTGYFRDAALKLRVLYCRKSGKPTLFETICDEFDLDLVVCAIPLDQKRGITNPWLPPDLMEGLMLGQSNEVVGWPNKGSVSAGLLEAIETSMVYVGGRYISYRDVIETIADKDCAHIDPVIDDAHLSIQSGSVLLGGLPTAQRALFDTAEVMVKIIEIVSDYVRRGVAHHTVRPRRS